jgi:CRISPR-associated protein Cas5t
MDKVLEIQFSGWTSTPRLPFVLSGNAICMPTPSYSLVLGIIGCCLGRNILATELKLGFKYSFDTVAKDLETRQRLENNGGKIKKHSKGSDAYLREFHVLPKLIVWLNKVEWKEFFENPIGTPSLGRSQDILCIDSVLLKDVERVDKGNLGGSLLPFSPSLNAAGQLVQLAESYIENEDVGAGRTPAASKMFISIPHDNNSEVVCGNLFRTKEEEPVYFYLHEFDNE